MPRLFCRLPPVPRKKVLDYIDAPSYKGWVEVRDLIVAPGMSLHDFADKIDRDWPGMFPSAIVVARASALVEERLRDFASFDI